MNQTLIIGCGALGIPLGLKCIEDGHPVTGIRRNIEKLPQGIKGVAFDLENQLPDIQWLAQFGVIYIILTPTERSATAYENMYGIIIPQLIERISQNDTNQRIILTSSTHVYAEFEGRRVDEETPTEAHDYRSRALITAEKSLLHMNQHAVDKKGICVRFSGLYTHESPFLVKQLYSETPITHPEHYMNRLHREDAVGFLHYLATLQEPKSLYLASDDCPVQRKVFFKALARKLSTQVKFEDDTTVGGKQCLNKRLKASGYTLAYPSYLEGYQLTI